MKALAIGQMPPLKIGQRIHCILYGGRNGTIHSIKGEQSPETTRSIMGWAGVSGGNAHFDIVWDDGTQSLAVPEALIRQSVQWKVLDEPPETPAQIKARLDYLASCTAERVRKQAVAEAEFKAEQARLIETYPNLKRCGDGISGGKLAAINIRTLLKKEFPGVKFKVRSDFNSVGVSWEDGPAAKQVSKIVNRFEAGRFDGMADIYKFTSSPWNSLFGSVEYNSVNREFSEALLDHCLDKMYEHVVNMQGVKRLPAKEMMSDWQTKLPSMGISVRDALIGLAASYDAINGTFNSEFVHYGQARWVVERVAEEEASKPTPTTMSPGL